MPLTGDYEPNALAWVRKQVELHESSGGTKDGAVGRDYRARLLEGEEKRQWWARAVEAYPAYEHYQAKTERDILVFPWEPVG
jgi:hypothetical protein